MEVPLRNPQHQIRRHDGADDRAAVTEQVDHLVQVLDLQPVVQRVAEAVGPVKQRQRAEDEKSEARERMADDSDEMCVSSGATSQPRGNARPNRNTRIGISSAASTPPALNSIHRNGSIDRFDNSLTEQEPADQG